MFGKNESKSLRNRSVHISIWLTYRTIRRGQYTLITLDHIVQNWSEIHISAKIVWSVYMIASSSLVSVFELKIRSWNKPGQQFCSGTFSITYRLPWRNISNWPHTQPMWNTICVWTYFLANTYCAWKPQMEFTPYHDDILCVAISM